MESRTETISIRKIVESRPDPVVIADFDGRMLFCNEAFASLLGYAREELLALDWRANLTPPEWLSAETATLWRIEEENRLGSYEKELLRKDGRRLRVRLTVFPPLEDFPGRYLALVALPEEGRPEEDILRESARHYRSLITRADTAICRIDTTRIIRYANPAMTRLLGCGGPGDLLGLDIAHLAVREQCARLEGFIDSSWWERSRACVARFSRRDRGTLRLRLSLFPLLDRGLPVGAFAILVRAPSRGPKRSADRLLDSFGCSPREREIGLLLASGLLYKEIADRLRIRLPTVRSHVMKLYGKLGVHSRGEMRDLLAQGRDSRSEAPASP